MRLADFVARDRDPALRAATGRGQAHGQGRRPARRFRRPAAAVSLRKFTVVLHNVGADLDATIAIDARNRFARLEIPAAALTVVRSDLASVGGAPADSAQPDRRRRHAFPRAGFNIAGTLTMPKGEGRLRHPTVVLVGGSGPVDRDETVAGIPIFAQLAGALAERGFMVLRYDKRGVGQSGGRIETVTLAGLRRRRDRHHQVAGEARRRGSSADGGRRPQRGRLGRDAGRRDARRRSPPSSWLPPPASTGADLVLEQQRHQLDLMKLPDAERQQKIDLQQKVQAAVISEKGLGGHARRGPHAGRHAVVQEPAPVRSRARSCRRSSSRS